MPCTPLHPNSPSPPCPAGDDRGMAAFGLRLLSFLAGKSVGSLGWAAWQVTAEIPFRFHRDSTEIPPRFHRDSANIPAEILLLLSSPRGHPSSPHSVPAGAAQRVRARGLLAARAARHPRPGLGRRARGRTLPHVHLLPEHLGSHRVHLRDRQQRRDAHPPRPLHQDRPRRRRSLPARGLRVRVRRQPPHRLRTSPRVRDRPVR